MEFEPRRSELPFDRSDAPAPGTTNPDGSPAAPADKADRTGLLGRDNEPDPGIGGADDQAPNVSGSVAKPPDPRPGLAVLSAPLIPPFLAPRRLEARLPGPRPVGPAGGETPPRGASARAPGRPAAA